MSASCGEMYVNPAMYVSPEDMVPTSATGPIKAWEDYPMWIKARDFAASAHLGQVRGDGVTPYIEHPIAVSDILKNEVRVTDEEVLVAAVLHDVLEDTSVTYAALLLLFGQRVADMVKEVTDPKDLTKEQQRECQLTHAITLSPGAATVKLADKLANFRDLFAAPPLNKTAAEKNAWISRAITLAKVVCTKVPPVLFRLFEKDITARTL
jgi:guanosine-3',5'-bis(diphosphate) 3'-pyrophosphohydrolase